ncbi:MAG: hypothetical protein ACLSUV_01610 [Bacilli bacterium]
MKQKNTKTKKIVLGLLLGVICLGAIGFGVHQAFNENKTSIVDVDESGVSETIESRGVKIKLLSTQVQADKSIVKTFKYSVEPSDATNKEVKVTALFADGSDCSSVITASVDKHTQTITITCKGAFKQKINVKVTSVDNPNAYANVILNYVKKIQSIEGTIKSLYVGNGWSQNYPEQHKDTTVTYADFITPTYSDYTKDKQYTFAMRDIEIIDDEFLIQGSLPDKDTEELYTKLNVMLYEAFNNQSALPTSEDMWNAVDTDTYRSWLLGVADLDPWEEDAYLCLEARGTIYCVEDPTISVQLGGGTHFYVYFSFQDDYSNLKVGVNNISVDTTEIDF